MRLESHSFQPGQRLPARFAAGQRTDAGVGFGPDRNPHLAWSDVPEGTRSFALLCIDPDVPTVPELVGRDDVRIPVEQPRTEFYHWAVADMPADTRELAEGACSDGVVPHGKQQPAGPEGSRQGLNDYTHWFAGDASMAGDWRGYDGPFPPPNDLRLHRYFFRLFALDTDRLELSERFDGPELLQAMHGHVLAEATLWGSYSLNPDVAG